MKERLEKVKKFVSDHKKELAIGAGTVVGGVVIYKITKKAPKFETIKQVSHIGTKIKELDIPKLDLGTIDDLWVDEFGTNLILNDVTVADLGKVGEEFLKIDGITNKTTVTAIVGLLDSVES